MRENKDQKISEYGRFYAVLFVCTAGAIHLTVLQTSTSATLNIKAMLSDFLLSE